MNILYDIIRKSIKNSGGRLQLCHIKSIIENTPNVLENTNMTFDEIISIFISWKKIKIEDGYVELLPYNVWETPEEDDSVMVKLNINKSAAFSSKTKIKSMDFNHIDCPCPICGDISNRHSVRSRLIKDIGFFYPVVLKLSISVHYCLTCNKTFRYPTNHLAFPLAKFTKRAQRIAIDLVEKGMSSSSASMEMRIKYYVSIPQSSLNEWYRAKQKNNNFWYS
ncbi:MAG: hypothetical protein AABY32_04130 [Nanoarchaeota archaeon]